MQMNIVHYCYTNSPVGELLLAGNADTLLLLGFPEGKLCYTPEPSWKHNPKAFTAHKEQLAEYFAGCRQTFDVPYDIQRSEFQRSVLQAVANVPYGVTTSYGEIAKKIKNPKAVRAVGGANARNPVPIIVPCHRIIGSNGTLTGFGGGLAIKEFLLKLEAQNITL